MPSGRGAAGEAASASASRAGLWQFLQTGCPSPSHPRPMRAPPDISLSPSLSLKTRGPPPGPSHDGTPCDGARGGAGWILTGWWCWVDTRGKCLKAGPAPPRPWIPPLPAFLVPHSHPKFSEIVSRGCWGFPGHCHKGTLRHSSRPCLSTPGKRWLCQVAPAAGIPGVRPSWVL